MPPGASEQLRAPAVAHHVGLPAELFLRFVFLFLAPGILPSGALSLPSFCPAATGHS